MARIVALGIAAVLGVAGCAPRERPAQDASNAGSTDVATNDTKARTQRDVGWVVLGAGAAATVVAIGTSALMLHDKAVRDDDCNAARVCSVEGLNANEDLRYSAGWNAGAWVAALAGVGIGAAIVLTVPRGYGEKTALTVTPTAYGGGAGASLGGAF